MTTEIGQIAGLIEHAGKEETPLQKQLQHLGAILVWVALAIVGLLFGLGLTRGHKPFELFMTSVSLAVAAVPEGLPAVVTLALTMGVLRMSRRGALVRRLSAVETLGETNVICTDKTGTLTVGEMTVRVLEVAGETFEVTGEGYAPVGKILSAGQVPRGRQLIHLSELLTIMAGCNDARLSEEAGRWQVLGSPTEGALLAVAGKFGINRERLERAYRKVREVSFDSERKLMTVVRRQDDDSCRALIKGAPEELVARCTRIYAAEGIRPLTDADRVRILEENSALAHQSLRVLAGAFRDLEPGESEGFNASEIERNLVFVGLVGMHDPPRAEAKEAVRHCASAGIRVVMITGDHPKTALSIANELGIATAGDRVLTGMDLEQMTDAALRQGVLNTNVYARVTAQHKLRLVHALKASGAVVAMTGDGANDAPALKGADIGVAMGRTGTEVSRQAADMVITDDNFASIVAAVEQGRGIHANIRKTLLYLLAGNAGELLLMFVCMLIGLPLPLLPIHLLWINLITDGLPALALATDPLDDDGMKVPPRSARDPIIGQSLLWTMALTGFLSAGVALAVYWHGLQAHGEFVARTWAFTTLVCADLFRSFGCRSETRLVWRLGLFGNLNLVLVVALSLLLQLFILRTDFIGHFFKTAIVSWTDCLWLLVVAALPAAVLELVKLVNQTTTPKKGKGTANSREAEIVPSR
jgi:Ca2+-transporting ATPase